MILQKRTKHIKVRMFCWHSLSTTALSILKTTWDYPDMSCGPGMDSSLENSGIF